MSARKRSGVVMSMSGVRRSLAAAAIAVGLATGAAACGGDDESEQADAEQAANQASSDKELAAIKTYLLEHTARLKADTAAIRENAEAYYELAESVGLRLRRACSQRAPRRGAGRSSKSGQKASSAPTRPTRRWRASSPACPSSPTTT